MGWAARAHVGGGNSKPVRLTGRFIRSDMFHDAIRRFGLFRAQYSDRRYQMDASGTMRRMAPALTITKVAD